MTKAVSERNPRLDLFTFQRQIAPLGLNATRVMLQALFVEKTRARSHWKSGPTS